MAELNEKLSKVLKDCGLGKDAVWLHKQSGKYIVYHWACEVAAESKGIVFEPPQIVTADPANKLAVICVTGRMGESSAWSLGEAAPYNTTQNYPFAMAEKRAKDRVILKLIGLHGLAYSEEEADDFKPSSRHVRDINTGSGSEPAPPERFDLFTPYGEVEETIEGPLSYLAELTTKLTAIGAYWQSNSDTVRYIGERYDGDVKANARKVWKFGEECWAQSPDNKEKKSA